MNKRSVKLEFLGGNNLTLEKELVIYSTNLELVVPLFLAITVDLIVLQMIVIT